MVAAVLLTLAAGMHALFGQPLAGPKSGTNDLVVLSIEGKLEFSAREPSSGTLAARTRCSMPEIGFARGNEACAPPVLEHADSARN